MKQFQPISSTKTAKRWEKIKPILEAHPAGIRAIDVVKLLPRGYQMSAQTVSHVAKRNGAEKVGKRPYRWRLPP